MLPELEPRPPRMTGLPIDERGYPVPWFVAWLDGKPEFRALDPQKFQAAIRQRLCWVCGQTLGVYKCFVAGPMCGINRTSSEPPSHVDCARWSARNCPFLSNPRMIRREDELIDNSKLVENTPGLALTRNPGVAMLWITRSYEIFRADNGYLMTMGEPESVEWYTLGQPATRAQVIESIETGMPILEAVARTEEGGLAALARAEARLVRWLPQEGTHELSPV